MPVRSFNEIVDTLIEMIAAKQFIDRLPTQRQLIHDFGSSSRTVQKAMDCLVSRNVIYSRPGKGYYLKRDGS